MRVTVVGCSGSFPGPDNPASCYLLEADGQRVLLDMGNGALGALAKYVDIFDVDAVLLSHLHADHCIDLTAYYVARKYNPSGSRAPLPVYGPAGTADRLARAYDLPSYPGMRPEFAFRTFATGMTYEVGPFTVTVDRVNHPVEAYGMRIRAGGQVLAYSGDTAATPHLVALARDADMFLCEASFHVGRDTTPVASPQFPMPRNAAAAPMMRYR